MPCRKNCGLIHCYWMYECIDRISLLFILENCFFKHSRYFACNDNNDNWELMLGEYRSNPKKDVELSLFSMVEENKTLSIEDQMFMLTSIPNHHKWLWPGEKFYHLKFEQRFSNCSRYFPGSPRNRIIQACSHRETLPKL